MDLAKIAFKGAYFTSGALAIRQAVSFGTVIYVARILAPADFGLVALVMVVVGFAQVLGDIGFSAGLVRAQTDSRIATSTVFWLGLIAGLFLGGALTITAPWAAHFYNEPAMESLLQVSAIGLVVNFCIPVPLAMLQQRLAYKSIAISQVAGSLIGALFTVVAVSFGFGVWSLILQPIIGNTISTLLMVNLSRWRPGFCFSIASVSKILGDGFNLLGAGLAQFARGNLDSALIGKALSSSDLGIYSMARTVLYAPNFLITSVVSRVLFPLLSKVQDKREDIEQVVLLSIKQISILAFPLYVGLWVSAPDFVMVVFGSKWLSMVDLLRIMIFASFVQSLGNIGGPVLVALGASRINLYLNIGGLIIYFIVLLIAVKISLSAVAIGYVIANSLIGLVTLFLALSVANISYREMFRVVANPIMISISLASVLLLVQWAAPDNALFRLFLVSLVGMFLYLILIYLTERKFLSQMRGAFR